MAAGDNVFRRTSACGLLFVCVVREPPAELRGAHRDGTVDWSQWMFLTAQEQAALWSQYRAIIQQEVARNKSNWRNGRRF